MNDKKSNKTYFNMSAGIYSGLMMEKRLAERMAKLLFKQQKEIQELLAANIDETEVPHWTLAYPDNVQTHVHFIRKSDGVDEKMRRVELFTKNQLIRKIDDVFYAESMEEAEHNYLEFHDKLEFEGKTLEQCK